jgi:HK97 family phage major capsid protein
MELALLFAALVAVVWQFFCGSAEAAGVVMAMAGVAMTDEQIKEFTTLLAEMKGGWAKLKDVPAEIEKFKGLELRLKACEDENTQLREMARLMARSNQMARVRGTGQELVSPYRNWKVGDAQPNVSDACAKYLAAVVILGAAGAKSEVKEAAFDWAKKHVIDDIDGFRAEPEFKSFGGKNSGLESFQKTIREIDYEQRAALTTTDIPMPIVYSGEVVELVSLFGTFRRFATVIPLPGGTFRLPKLTTSPAFGFIDMSAAVTEKSPQITFVDFDAKKAGGIVRIPTEIDEDSVVAMGQFIARYIAREMASWEDATGWLADGSATYKTLEGVVQRIVTNVTQVTLGAGLTASDDTTLAALRQSRAKVHESIIAKGMGAYYLNATMEQLLVSFNTDTNGEVFRINTAQGQATLDGWPIFWINKLPVYSASAIINTIVAAFGDMTFWYLGLRGGLRIDTSREAYFSTDEIGIRALERFTVKEMATTHMGGVRTAAA